MQEYSSNRGLLELNFAGFTLVYPLDIRLNEFSELVWTWRRRELVLISWEFNAVGRLSLYYTTPNYRNISITHNVVYFQYTSRIAGTYGIVAPKMFVSVCIVMRGRERKWRNDEVLMGEVATEGGVCLVQHWTDGNWPRKLIPLGWLCTAKYSKSCGTLGVIRTNRMLRPTWSLAGWLDELLRSVR